MTHARLPGRPAARVRAALAALAALVAAAAPPAGAQTSTASLRGYVTGTGGAPLADAQVAVRSLSTNATRGTLTNAAGFFYVGGLRPDRYEVVVRRLGFTPQTRTVTLPIGQTVDLNVAIAEAAVQLTAVQVTAAAGGTETRTSEVGTNITREQIQNLPNFERNFLDIAKLVPGITATAPNNNDKFLAAGGQPAEAVNVFVDGATYKNDVLRGGVVGQDASKGNPFPQGAVQEFRVITQNYKAEYQKAASAIITATTRSGSNVWEADAFASGIGKSYVARDAIAIRNAGPRSSYQRLQAGGSVGGPIRQDKLFFFGTYELNFRDEPQTVTLGGNAAQAPASLNLSQYLGQFTSTFREHLGFAKVTWNKSARSTVDASVNLRHEEDFRGFGGQTSFQSAENVAIRTSTGVANWKYAGDRFLNEAQVNLQGFVWNPGPLNAGIVGRDYQGVLRIGGRDTRQEFTQYRASLRDDVTRGGIQLGGDHVFKGGASLDFLNYKAVKDFNGNPTFRYRAAESFARPFEASFGFGDPDISTNNVQLGAYVQDDWSIGRKLVLNLGIRWDAETNMINNGYVTPRPLADSLRGPLADRFYVERNTGSSPAPRVRVIDELGGIENFITTGRSDRPIYLKAFQPRLGASYDFTGEGRTVLFGGGGLYFDRNYWNTLLDEQFRRQFKVLNVQFRGTAAECAATNSPATCTVWNDRYLDPAQLRTLAGTTGRPEVFLVKNDLVPPRSIQMTAGIRQAIGAMQLTVSYNGVRGHHFMNFIRATPWGGLGPNYAQAFITDDRVKTWYDAMQLQLERPLRATTRWGGALAYTLSRSEEQGQSTDLFWGFDDRYPTVADRPRRRSPGDQRHAIVANAVGRLPGDFRLSGIVTLGTGITVNATDASLGFETGRQRTYVFSPPTRPFLGFGHVFATQNLDLRLDKGFRVASGQDVSVVVDLFNVTNTPNYGCFDTTIFPTSGAPNANYGRANCAGLGRRLQLGLRYGLRPAAAR